MKFRERLPVLCSDTDPVMLSDLQVLTLTLFGEAFDKGWDDGMVIGNIILNRWLLRKKERAFREAESIGDICLWPGQFRCWDEDKNERAMIYRALDLNLSPLEGRVFQQCRHIAAGVERGLWIDRLRGGDAYHFYPDRRSIYRPGWARDQNFVGKFGQAWVYRVWG